MHAPDEPELERQTVELFLRHDVRYVEAAAFTRVTAPLVLFRHRGGPRHIVAKVSRPEVAATFMQPAPEAILRELVSEGALTEAEAQAAGRYPVSADVCVEADSAGHTDGGVALHHLGTERDAAGGDRGPHRRRAHHLDAGGDDHVVGPGDHALGGEVGGLL